MIVNGALSDFQCQCHEYYTCFTFASLGLQNVADKFRSIIDTDSNPNKNPNLFIGNGNPNEGKAQARILLKDAMFYSEKDSVFSDTLAKSILVVIYTEWEETYRPRIAAEFGVETKSVSCDLMSDLRLIRHWIIHNKSLIDKNYTKIQTLSWRLQRNQRLEISSDMFSNMMDDINAMKLSINK